MEDSFQITRILVIMKRTGKAACPLSYIKFPSQILNIKDGKSLFLGIRRNSIWLRYMECEHQDICGDSPVQIITIEGEENVNTKVNMLQCPSGTHCYLNTGLFKTYMGHNNRQLQTFGHKRV